MRLTFNRYYFNNRTPYGAVTADSKLGICGDVWYTLINTYSAMLKHKSYSPSYDSDKHDNPKKSKIAYGYATSS